MKEQHFTHFSPEAIEELHTIFENDPFAQCLCLHFVNDSNSYLDNVETWAESYRIVGTLDDRCTDSAFILRLNHIYRKSVRYYSKIYDYDGGGITNLSPEACREVATEVCGLAIMIYCTLYGNRQLYDTLELSLPDSKEKGYYNTLYVTGIADKIDLPLPLWSEIEEVIAKQYPTEPSEQEVAALKREMEALAAERDLYKEKALALQKMYEDDEDEDNPKGKTVILSQHEAIYLMEYLHFYTAKHNYSDVAAFLSLVTGKSVKSYSTKLSAKNDLSDQKKKRTTGYFFEKKKLLAMKSESKS